MSYRPEVVEEAKKLYLELDEFGNKKYGLKAIAKILNQKFNLSLNHVTIKNWRDREKWDEVLQKKIALASSTELKSVSITPEDIVDQEDKIKEIVSKAKGYSLVALVRLSKKLDKVVSSMDPMDKRFPRIAEVAGKVFATTHEILEKYSDTKQHEGNTVIVINEIKTEVKNED